MIAWFTRNGVAANLIMLILAIGGIASAFMVKRELFPTFSLDLVTIRVPYLGASPEEVEESVIVRIEEAIQAVDGIEEMNSVAQEGYGLVNVTVDRGYDIGKVKDEIKTRVDAITTFPANTERPIVDEPLIPKEVIRVSVYGDASEKQIKKIADRVRDDLVELDGISQVNVDGVRDYEVSIEVSESALRNYNLSFDQVVQAVRGSSIDLPGGLIKANGGEISLRTKEQDYVGNDFRDIVLLANPDGGKLTLGEVATVKDGFADQDIVTLFNGKPAAIVLVKEVGDENPLEISEMVYEYVEEAMDTWVPEGVALEAWSDSSFYLQGRIDMLVENGLIGFGLVLIALAVFLRPTLAFFVAIGIPVSFLATIAIAPGLGITINLLSLFAFILVLGIVVDDAIVVGESVFTEFQRNGPGVESAIRGAHRVSMPVTFAVITTAVAFIPVFFLPGMIGKFMYTVPVVVIPTLLFSLVQSKLVLPYHLSLCHVGDKDGRSKLNPFSRLQRKFSDGMERFIDNVYMPTLDKALKFRWLTLSLFLSALLLSFSLVAFGAIRFVFFPSVPSDYIFLELKMAEGTPIQETTKAINRIDEAIDEIAAEQMAAGQINLIKNKAVFLGYSVVSGGPSPASFNSGGNIGSVILELSKAEVRDSNADEIARLWREKVGEIPGARKLNFMSNASGPAGLPVDIRLTGRNFDDLKAASLEIQEELKQFDGLLDIRDTYSEGERELKVTLKDNARALGLTAASLGQQIRFAFYGAEAQRVQRDKEDVRVMVRYPEEDRDSLGNLESMRIVAPNGARIPISEVANVESGTGYPSISRLDRNRTINVQADADKAVLNSDSLNAALYGKYPSDHNSILGRVLEKYPGVTPIKGGEAKDMEESIPAIMTGGVLVLVIIYALLAIPFKSYLQPLIVISVIPFGIGGAIYGHLINFQNFGTPQDLSLLSLLGIIAMSGVVVNDSLVLVERINRLRHEEGMSVFDAVHVGGSQRFRAIILTSVTTFVGLVPILMEKSLQAQFLIPMATSLAFGVLFATFITLLLVPCSYLILEDYKRFFVWWWRGIRRLPKESKPQVSEPAA
jgi:multidrug efflux pump subunit AcrB